LATNPPYAGYLTPAQIIAAAEYAASQATANALAEQQSGSQAQGQAIQGFSQAAAQQVAPIGGQVQGGYQDAAARTAQYGKGFSIGMQLAQQNSANDINSFLAKNGSPTGQQVQGNTGAADVLYGSTGFIPASGLEREGAAFGAAASQLPATMLGLGQQTLAQHIATSKKDRQAILDKRDSLRSQIGQDLSQTQNATYATYLQGKALGLKEKTALADQAEFLTEMLGTVHVVRNGKIVDTGRAAPGSDAYDETTLSPGESNPNAPKLPKVISQQERNKKFAEVSSGLSPYIRSNFTRIENKHILAGTPGHPKYVKKPYQQAFDELWDANWPQLEALGAGKPMRARLAAAIKSALARQGIRPKRRDTRKPGDR
jgi:hypothetical protein